MYGTTHVENVEDDNICKMEDRFPTHSNFVEVEKTKE